jgi:hypothetical protein
MKTIILSFLIAHFAFLISQWGVAQIIHIPANQPTIQAGIDAATDGDTVLVADGTYLENISFQGKAITVASQFLMDGDTNHINNTVIDGSQPANPDTASVVRFCNGEDTTSIICGFTITGGEGSPEPSFGATVGGGIYCYEAGAKIIHNKIHANNVTDLLYAFGGGIASLKDDVHNWTVIEHNTIWDNHSATTNYFATGGAIEMWGDARICHNIIEGNSCTSAQGIAMGGGIYIEAIVANQPDTLYCHGNNIRNNSVAGNGPTDSGGLFAAYLEAFITSNIFSYNSVSSPDEARGAGMTGWYSNMYISDNEFSHNTLEGFHTDGAGIYLYHPKVLEFINNTVNYNTVVADSIWWGAGMMCESPVNLLKLIDNEFSNNSGPVAPIGAGGGLCILDALDVPVIVEGNRFSHNIAYNGGGLFMKWVYNAAVYNNTFFGNETFRGGGLSLHNPVMGRISHLTDQPVIINNSFRDNSASNDGGGLRFSGDDHAPEIYNCIFWENTAPSGRDIRNWCTLPVTVSYCDLNTNYIGGNWNGENNIDADPLFTDDLCHIGALSLCRDTGYQSFLSPLSDLDMEPRPDPVYGLIDIGADEFYDVPQAPEALYPEDIGEDYFVAQWTSSLWALGYSLDVAFDEGFDSLVPGYDNLTLGKDTFALVSGLTPYVYYFRVRAYNALWTSQNSNTIQVLGVGIEADAVQSSEFRVLSYPNPFTDHSTIQFTLPEPGEVTLKLYDLTGREVRSLVSGHREKGEHRVMLNGSELNTGMYILRGNAGERVIMQKLIIMR